MGLSMRFTIPYNWYRAMGMTAMFAVLYMVVIGIFGKVDISHLMPVKLAKSIQESWPQLPFFEVESEMVNDGKQKEIRYTVPTRQLTPEEVLRFSQALSHPAPPQKTEAK